MRERDLTRRVVTPEGAAREFHGLAGQGGLMFGPERTGLLTEDLAVAHAILTIPVNPDFGSLNLAQAVVVTAYEWFRQAAARPSGALVNYDGPAPHEELEGLIGAIDAQLTANGYFNPVPGRAAATRLVMRNLFTRPEFSAGEVRTLRGIIRGLSRKRNGGPEHD
jgi:tRNA/rRNA methyltransferase